MSETETEFIDTALTNVQFFIPKLACAHTSLSINVSLKKRLEIEALLCVLFLLCLLLRKENRRKITASSEPGEDSVCVCVTGEDRAQRRRRFLLRSAVTLLELIPGREALWGRTPCLQRRAPPCHPHEGELSRNQYAA